LYVHNVTLKIISKVISTISFVSAESIIKCKMNDGRTSTSADMITTIGSFIILLPIKIVYLSGHVIHHPRMDVVT
jgi:hypothetical protein